MAEEKNYTNNTERPREDEELEIDLMEYVRKLWAARKMLLKVAGIGAIVEMCIRDSLLGYDICSSSVKASLVNAETGKCVSSAFLYV